MVCPWSSYNTINYFTVGGEVMVWNGTAPVCLSDFPNRQTGSDVNCNIYEGIALVIA